LLTGLEAGVVPLGGTSLDGRFEMPRAMSHRYRMPLWNYLFELHNGRFFKDWIGAFYLLVPVLGSLLFFVLTATGVFDWVYLKVILPRRKRKQRARRALAV
jgi:hypothetical protein